MKSLLKKFGTAAKEKRKSENKSNRLFDFNPGVDINDHYNVKHVVGKGTFSQVKLGIHRENGNQVAIKIIDKNNIDVKLESLQTEVCILMNVKDPNIVNLFDVYEDDRNVYMVMELMLGGELFERICNEYPMGYSEKLSSKLIKKIIVAVAYLHSNGIIHRDLKPENLLYASPEDEENIKISDFGLAKIWRSDMVIKTACGSPNYVAPEVLMNEQAGYSYAVDMWSIGVILYVLLCGFCPFFDLNTPTLFTLITTGAYSFPSPYWDNISGAAKDLISQLLVVEPSKRLTAAQALEHPWLNNEVSDKVIPNIIRNLEETKGGSRSLSSLNLNSG